MTDADDAGLLGAGSVSAGVTDPANVAVLACLAVLAGEVERARLEAEVERLRDALHRDTTGLAKALEQVTRLCNGYNWATVGRGPYEWDDDEYRAEFGRALEAIHTVAYRALVDSGSLAIAALAESPPSG